MYAEIVFPIPLNKKFHYSIPHNLLPQLKVGIRIMAEFGKRLETGYCVGLTENSPVKYSKPIKSLIDNEPMLDEKMMALTRWMSEYYFCSWGQALEAALPSGVRKQKIGQRELMVTLNLPPTIATNEDLSKLDSLGRISPQQKRILAFLLELETPTLSFRELTSRLKISPAPINSLRRKNLLKVFKRTLDYDPFLDTPISITAPLKPTPEQGQALKIIQKALERNETKTILLHGITGSGKTEVYLQAIQHVLSQGRQAIVLIPEIALTPQTIFRFRSRFAADDIAVLHSYLSEGPRAQQWHKIKTGTAKIVIGARSAIFAPTPRLGLVVIDEEHEPSFKQENAPMYHAREVAQTRIQLEQAVLVLGSATPSLESFYKASQNEYTRVELPERIEKRPLPPVEIIDLGREISPKKPQPVLSRKLQLAISENLEEHNQVILFLNRRGFSTFIVCPRCGFIARCPRCQVAYTYHKKINQIMCHYCNETRATPTTCAECGHAKLKYLGSGTEKVEELIKKLFNDYKTARMDSDIMKTHRAYKTALNELDTGKVNILIGTQMVAKGLDFPNVTLVGIILGDSALYLNDLRSAERTFQLITQVAGRTGRGPKGGRVLLQTFNPDHYSIRHGATHNYPKFAEEELAHRQELNYPPFSQLLRILVEGRDLDKVKDSIEKIYAKLTYPKQQASIELLGPAPAPMEKIKGRYRWHLLVKSKDIDTLRSLIYNPNKANELKQMHKNFISTGRAVKISLDMDPVNLL